MATKKKAKASKGEPKERSSKSRDDEKLLIRIRDRFKVMSEADDDNRRLAMADLKFVNEPGAQWDANMLKHRGARPAYEFNKLKINGKRVINEIRANRPQIKVRAVEGGDKEGAELREGLFRNIANMSDLDTVTDQAAEYQVDAGYAVIRVDREYAADSVFDQDILIRSVKNPFCVYSDPSCKDILLRRDADDWIVTEKISKSAFETKYGEVEKIDFEDSVEFDDEDDWEDGESVRVAEYWYKEPYDKEIWLVEFPPEQEGMPGKQLAVDSTTDEAEAMKAQYGPALEQMIQRKRTAKCHKIMMCVASGDAILEGPTEEPGSMFPFVPVYGEIKVIDGKVVWWGLHRFSKDAQRVYNFDRTAAAESAHAAAKSQYWVTKDQVTGLAAQWKKAHDENMPFMVYNHDAKSPGPPQRMAGPELPIAFMNLAEIDAADIRDTSGLHEASFGEESDEKSGVALARKQHQAGIVTYNFPDNIAKAIKRVGEIALDKIPHVYDAERELRIIGADGAEDYKRVNQLTFDNATGKTIRVNDLSAGRYDFAVTPGPSYATLRQEAAEIYSQLYPPDSPVYPFVADLIAKAQDLPFSEQMAKRLQLAAPPQVQQMEQEGKDIPPEVQAAMGQVQQAQAMVDQKAQLVQQAAQEVGQDQAKSEKAKAEVKTELANLKAARAEFDAHVAEIKAEFTQREAKIGMDGMQHNARGLELDFRQTQLDSQQQQTDAGSDGVQKAQEAVAQIDAMAAQFMQVASQMMQKLEGMLAEIKAKPRVKSVRMERKNGQPPRAVAEYDDVPAVVQ